MRAPADRWRVHAAVRDTREQSASALTSEHHGPEDPWRGDSMLQHTVIRRWRRSLGAVAVALTLVVFGHTEAQGQQQKPNMVLYQHRHWWRIVWKALKLLDLTWHLPTQAFGFCEFATSVNMVFRPSSGARSSSNA